MINFKEYTEQHTGKQVFVSTTSGRVEGTLFGAKVDNEGNVIALIIKQYLHKLNVSTDEILNIRVV